MRKIILFGTCLMSLTGCMSQFARGSDSSTTSSEVYDLRMEVAELKHTIQAQKVDLEILEEKMGQNKPKEASSEKIAKLEQTLHQLQRFQEACIKDLKHLQEALSNTSQHLSSQGELLSHIQSELHLQGKQMSDIKDLKSTLSSLKQVMSDSPSYHIYKVKAGDSLERIARQKGISVDKIKQYNQLNSSTIYVGQELKLPHD